MKQRFSSLDLKAATAEFNEKLQGTRLANIYDLNSRTFLLKFAKQGEKHNILIESGYRVHLTDYSRETAQTPSNFCAKLRKHVRTRRITHAKQLGTDRVLVLTFGGGENNADPERSYYIILEFYAGGNVILTDGYHKILSLLRVVGEDEGQKVSVGEIYDFDRRVGTEFVPITRERLINVIETANKGTQTTRAKDEDQDEEAPRNALQTKKAKATKKKEKGAGTIKKVLAANLPQYGTALVEHSILEAGMNPGAPMETLDPSQSSFDDLFKAFESADAIVQKCGHVTPGYIIAKIEGELEVFDDFQPFLPRQVAGNSSLKAIEVETYNGCIDKFFSSLEAQKLEQRIRTQEVLAARRIQAAKDEHQKKIDGLVATQETSAKKAAALEGSQGIIDEAINAVNNLLEQGMDWVDIERLIRTEAKQGNLVAQVIKLPLKLSENRMTVQVKDLDELYNEDTESDSGDETDSTQDSSEEDSSDSSAESDVVSKSSKHKQAPQQVQINGTEKSKQSLLDVDVDLSQTAFANARQYYAARRTALTKEDKTLQSSKKALKSTQQKIEKDLRKNLSSEKTLMRQIRKVYWFEKFLWFISSEGYLVLGGHDAQQNELLFRRHFRKGDIYVHADLNGAASVIVKNTHTDQPIPPSTLSQAGTLSVATSQAWDAKMVISAWYVNYEQVSKTAPTGEYLTTGSFMIRGKKNFLPPAKLELGYGMLFVVDEPSRDRHVKAKLSHIAEDRKYESLPSVDVIPKELPAIVPQVHVSKSVEGQPPLVTDSDSLSVMEESSNVNDPQPGQIDKYALEQYGHDQEQDQSEEFSGKAKHMSAKDRREARKARAGGSSEPVVPESKNVDETAQKINQKNSEKKQPPAQLTRGQKAKKKKMAKYADQDEDDKLLAQKLLGIKIKSDEKSASEDDDTSTTAQKKPNELKQSGSSRPQRPPKANPEIAKLMQEEGVVQLDEDEQEQITALDIFVSQPLKDDVLLEAIPTCAPYGAMARFKYKCKLQPGSTKKGKAVKSVLSGWLSGKVDEAAADPESLWPRERELMKGLRDQELTAPIGVSKVKITLAKGEMAAKNKAKRSSRK